MRNLRALSKYLIRGYKDGLLGSIGIAIYKIPVYGENVIVTVSQEHICISYEKNTSRVPDDKKIQNVINAFYDKSERAELVMETVRGDSVATVHIYKAKT